MKILNSTINLGAFFNRLRKASRKVLFLDYDGTLAPFRTDRHKALPYPGVRELLNKIIRVPAIRLVIITGRWIEDLKPLLQLQGRPEIWGSHGLEHLRKDGSYEIVTMDEASLTGLVAADEWIDTVGLSDRSEKKPGCLAIHWRGLNDKEMAEVKNEVEPKLSLIAQTWGLSLQNFDGGLELRVPGRNKGNAVAEILQEMGQSTAAAYLGDDLTDEEAFKSIKDKGVGVLVRKELRPTAADLWIKPPEELLEFLSAWLPESKEDERTR